MTGKAYSRGGAEVGIRAEVRLSLGQRLTCWAIRPGQGSECLAIATAARSLQKAETAAPG